MELLLIKVCKSGEWGGFGKGHTYKTDARWDLLKVQQIPSSQKCHSLLGCLPFSAHIKTGTKQKITFIRTRSTSHQIFPISQVKQSLPNYENIKFYIGAFHSHCLTGLVPQKDYLINSFKHMTLVELFTGKGSVGRVAQSGFQCDLTQFERC